MDVEQLPDGSLLVSDDAPSTGAVYRVSYREPVACRGTTTAGRKLQEDEGEDGINLTLYPSSEWPPGDSLAPCPRAARKVRIARLATGLLGYGRGSSTCTDARLAAGRSTPPAAIPGAANGCAVNLGSYGVQRYRQGPAAPVPPSAGHAPPPANHASACMLLGVPWTGMPMLALPAPAPLAFHYPAPSH